MIYSKAAFSLHTLSLGVMIVTVIQSLVAYVRSILLSHFSFKTDLQLNFSYLSHIFNLPLSFFESRKSGEILSRLGDLDKIKQTLSNAALSGVMDAVMFLVSGPILLGINARFFGISIATVLLVALISMIFAKIYRSYYSKVMSQNADVQSYLYESLNGVATVKALNAEEIVNGEYEKKKMTAVNTSWTLNKYGISQGLISGLINGISGILVYWLGCSAILGGTMSFGTLITFNSLLGYFTGPLFCLRHLHPALTRRNNHLRDRNLFFYLNNDFLGDHRHNNRRRQFDHPALHFPKSKYFFYTLAKSFAILGSGDNQRSHDFEGKTASRILPSATFGYKKISLTKSVTKLCLRPDLQKTNPALSKFHQPDRKANCRPA